MTTIQSRKRSIQQTSSKKSEVKERRKYIRFVGSENPSGEAFEAASHKG